MRREEKKSAGPGERARAERGRGKGERQTRKKHQPHARFRNQERDSKFSLRPSPVHSNHSSLEHLIRVGCSVGDVPVGPKERRRGKVSGAA